MADCFSVSRRSTLHPKAAISGKGCAPIFPTGWTAMVVDDDPIVLGCTAHMLRLIGFTTFESGKSDEALSHLKRHVCDLLLTDYAMPILDGYQLGCKVKATCGETRIVIMTGHCEAAVAQFMNDRRVDGWLFKPFRMQDLKDTLLSIGLPIASGHPSKAAAPLEN